MAYRIEKGILHHDGRPVFALGASYYPSFLPSKYPVPADGDRVGEMKKDLHRMKEIGLNYFRTAALGDLWRDEQGEVAVATDFIDGMIRQAEEEDLAASIRLNGYSVNLSGNENYEFVNEKGEPMEKQWSAFMHACLHHEGFLRDNADATRALAAHYAAFPAVVSYQVYNEPHYPFNGVFDYHPDAIAAFRKWLVAHGKKTEQEAASLEPPRRRPTDRAEIGDWILWRQFAMESMCRFLDATAQAAQEGARDKDIYTCYTVSVAGNRQADMGITYFDDAPHLTTTTVTNYVSFDGADYYAAAFVTAMAYSAAAVMGRRAWTAELDKRTAMPASKFRRETYEVIGAGHKGICYYAWRGDYPDPVTPEPDVCGFLHYDGRPTDSFERDVAMLKMVNDCSTELVTAERLSSGVAVLHSDRSVLHFDALTDPQIGGKNFRVRLAVETFRELKKNGVAPDIVRACDLEKNVLGVKVLFVPSQEGMSKEEWAQLGAFAAGEGHHVFYGDQTATFGSISVGGWWEAGHKPGNRNVDEFRGGYEIEDVLQKLGLRSLVETGHKNLFAHVLQGEKRKIVVLVSNAPDEAAIPAHVLRLNFPFTRATLRTPEQEVALRVEGEQVFLPAIADGALLFVE